MYKLEKKDSRSGESSYLLFTVFLLSTGGKKTVNKHIFNFIFLYFRRVENALVFLFSEIYRHYLQFKSSVFNRSEVAKNKCTYCRFLRRELGFIRDIFSLKWYLNGITPYRTLNDDTAFCAGCQLSKLDCKPALKRSSKVVLNRHLYHQKKKCNKVFRLSWREISKC